MEDKKIDEGIYLRKGKWGYRIIYPIKREDGSLNWFNLLCGGSYWNLAKTVMVLFLILLIVYSYNHDIKAYKDVSDYVTAHPCDWCNKLTSTDALNTGFNFSINISGLKNGT